MKFTTVSSFYIRGGIGLELSSHLSRTDNTIFADVYVATDGLSTNHATFPDENVIADLLREESQTFGDFLVRGSDNDMLRDYAAPANPDVGQVAPNYRTWKRTKFESTVLQLQMKTECRIS